MVRDLPFANTPPMLGVLEHPLVGAQSLFGLGNSFSDLALLALDHLGIPVLFVDTSARLLYRNRAAEALLLPGSLLGLRAGRLQPASTQHQHTLSQALTIAASERRAYLRLDAGERSLSLVAVSLEGSGAHAQTRLALVGAPNASSTEQRIELFARAHQITGAEQMTLGLLERGLGAPQIAVRLGVATSTVRSHLKSICRKTRAHGIREVVAQLADLPPIHGSAERSTPLQ